MTEARATLKEAFFSRRLGPVTLLSLSSGLPLGLVTISMPAWLALAGIDIKTIGLLTLSQLPWGFKFLWSPILDRLHPPFLGARRGWIVLCQAALALLVVGLGLWAASVPTCQPGSPTCAQLPPVSGGVVLALSVLSLLISFAAASQDIAYDAYAVDVLQPREHGAMVGARSALYRVGMWIAGNIAIWLGPWWGWSTTIVAQGALFLALIPATVLAPEPQTPPGTPRSLLEAVWLPFVGLLGRPRALEIIGFVLLYRLADSIAGALVSPFLLQHGFSAIDVGPVRGGVGVLGTLLGTVWGGALAQRLGLGKALWLCGVLQILSNGGYALVALVSPQTGAIHLASPAAFPAFLTFDVTVSAPLQAAIFVETLTGGMGWGAFGVLLLRLTDKRFSATQYALFSSLVGLARTFVGPLAGVMADTLGWPIFFVVTMLFGLPGLVMLGRFVPWGSEPKEITGEALEAEAPGPPWPTSALVRSGVTVAVLVGAGMACLSAVLAATKGWRAGTGFDVGDGFAKVLLPGSVTESVDLLTAVVFGAMAGIGVAAYRAARGRQRSPIVTR